MSVLSALRAFATAIENDTGAEGTITVDVPQRVYDMAHAEMHELTRWLEMKPGERYGWPIQYQSSGVRVLIKSSELERKLSGVYERAVAATVR